MKNIAANLMILLSLSLNTAAAESDAAQVMMFGTFHFSNPGLDVVKHDEVNVLTHDNQVYLQAMTKRIANEFKPTAVLLECALASQAKVDKEYAAYLKGDYALAVNEIDQVGYRVAKQVGLAQVTCFDEREVQWKAEALHKVMPESNPALQAEFESTVQDLVAEFNALSATLTLGEMLREMNSTQRDLQNKSFYLLTNEVGAMGEGFYGADSAASWWHRNFRMYANVQKIAQPGERVLVLAGQGHTSIMKDLLELDQKRQARSIVPLL
ncbi:hypothetical protein GCM10008090_06630 [Arenicella chitinivorans]|uniref:TraB/GumN family protein n=1 Tax=Arenicella chitinivorans TaxID=1329800 RepID=A0A918RM63_9GAMM|nr:DUF5694 domain-containing protein [Arenicella chitinivorans]GHA00500.1 hypothetical protein GCM10008090_06630 [Arenicella chitinivorans]